MAKLNQLIAIAKGVKGDAYSKVTNSYHQLQKLPLFAGLVRTYRPLDEENGEKLPGESKLLQLRAEDVLADVAKELTRLFDVTATIDFTNTIARADVIVDGEVLIESAPVPFLLFLEKQLKDLEAMVRKLPMLDPARTWTYDPNTAAQRAETETTIRQKKVPKNHVLAPATDKHPAQVQPYNEDVLVGYWDTVHFSGALPLARVKQLLERIDTLRQAVKFAREQANMAEVVDKRGIGKKVFDFLLAA